MTETSTTTDTTIPVVAVDASAISKNALDAVTVVEAARMFGLPVPFAVSFSAYGVDATVESYDQVVTWAETMHVVEVSKHLHPDDATRARFTATGVIAGATVSVSAMGDAGADQ